MKENKLKLSMTLSAEVVRTLDDYALALNVSRSRVLDDILLQALPAMKPMIEAMVAVRGGATLAEVEPLLQQVSQEADLMMNDIESMR